jgi:hypothetical protein
MDKKELWPKTGKAKKGLAILGIVIVAALLITLLEEKTKIKISSKGVFPIALICVGIWFYNPAKRKSSSSDNNI